MHVCLSSIIKERLGPMDKNDNLEEMGLYMENICLSVLCVANLCVHVCICVNMYPIHFSILK